ncbi:alpha-amylase [PVC group bacterium]|nr:alpha-amylase [PVC group bacterium]
MNSARDLLKHPENAVDASELSAFDLIDEIMHYVVEAHCSSKNPDFFSDIHEHLSQEIGNSDFQKFLENFASLFPPPEILSGDKTAETFLTSKTDGISNKLTTLEEILLLWIENQNKAGSKLRELVDEKTLTAKDEYEKTVALFQKSLKTEKTGKGKKKSLIDLILEPILKYPDSLLEQLKFMEKEWEIDISPFRSRILGCVDFLKEEQKMRFDPNLFGPGPIEVADYSSADFEAEQFSDDRDWMPRVVLLAKNTYVWLHQLSEQYQRPINTLADIPDEELSILSSRGFTGLWLIGIWERSTASRKIKQMLGNPEAAASAYSLKSYSIANDIGGDEAYMNLKQRAWDKGLRLACDMVPNHMGTDSEWVAEHPDWFVSCDHPPFPSYQFTCENLLDDPRMSVYIEDGYWHKTDAAVVFKRVDNNTGQETYIYHGNDGTHLPWNDTAQLNYLLPHVREAVIQTILHVARMFPIIRFDAAMTLAKKHFHRLWFPEPGSGGDIPSRSQYGMTRPDFDKVFPAEFWREVVDRVRKEVPDSLLLAEAFWLMEGYFVRTLGMHRVYNSAFMHMLRDEENAKYRESIRNVLEFDPRILERHVNFMSNPDEDSAVAQFGNDDKYFGTCIVMATMPGLPMFGHGQIEGYAEKYGMEYRRAYLNESVNEGLVARHEYHIFPLLRKRYLFSGVYNYRLYDVVNHDGHAIEDVFAYSNRCGNEKSLVVYHNRYGDADGRIRMSVQYKTQDGNMNHTKLADGLGLGHGHDRYVILKESISNLEYLISCDELHERGLPISLGAYKALVFLDIREVISTKDRPYAKLSMQNGWQGLPGIEDAIDEMLYDPIITATENAVSPETLQQFQRELTIGDDSESEDSIASVLDSFASAFADFEKLEPVSSDKLKRYIDVARSMADLENSPSADFDKANAKNETGSNSYLPRTKFHHLEGWRILLAIPFLMTLRKLYSTHPNEVIKERFLHERFILRVIQRNFEKIGITKEQAALDVQILDILTMAASDRKLPAGNSLGDYFEKLFSNADVQRYLRVNRFKNTVYFNKERFEVILPWLCLMSAATNASSSTKTEEIIKAAQRAKKAAEKAEYQLDKFLTTLESD